MKVFFVVQEPFPHGKAATSRVINYCRGLLSQGVDCEVLIPHPTERRKGVIRNTEAVGNFDGIPFRYISGTTRQSKIRGYNRFIKSKIDLFDILKYIKRNTTTQSSLIVLYDGARLGLLFNKLICKVVHRNHAKIVRVLGEWKHKISKYVPPNSEGLS